MFYFEHLSVVAYQAGTHTHTALLILHVSLPVALNTVTALHRAQTRERSSQGKALRLCMFVALLAAGVIVSFCYVTVH